MKKLAKRRIRNFGITLIACVILLIVFRIMSSTLYPDAYVSGWILAASIVFLVAYNVRKALSFLPLGTSATWLQIHIYVGLITFCIFAIHVQFRVPNGWFECTLAAVYVTVFVSGVVGLYMTRSLPRRINQLGNEVVFESIPIQLHRLRQHVEQKVLACSEESGATAIAELFTADIQPFLARHHNFWAHLLLGTHPRFRKLSTEISNTSRFLTDEEKAVMQSIETLLHRKNELDGQYALQAALKYWLFIHVPLSYALLVFTFFHSMLVHAWSGGLS